MWTIANIRHTFHSRLPTLNFIEIRLLLSYTTHSYDLHSVWSTVTVRKWLPCRRRVSSCIGPLGVTQMFSPSRHYWITFLPDFNQIRNLSIDSRKAPNIEFHRNPSSGSRTVKYGRTDRTTVIVAFCDYTSAHIQWE